MKVALALVVALAACSSKKKEAPVEDKPAVAPAPAPPPATTAPKPGTPPAANGPATIDTSTLGSGTAPAPAQPTLNATQRTVGIIHAHRTELGACVPDSAGSTMINLHIAADGKVTFELWTKQDVGADVKGCVAAALAKIQFPAEKVDVAADI